MVLVGIFGGNRNGSGSGNGNKIWRKILEKLRIKPKETKIEKTKIEKTKINETNIREGILTPIEEGILTPIIRPSIDPIATMSDYEKQILFAQRKLLKMEEPRFVDAAKQKNLQELANVFAETVRELFPKAEGIIFLSKKEKDYEVVYSEGNIDPRKLNLSSSNSIVRTAGDVPESFRRTIYIPSLDKSMVYLASKFDTVTERGFEPNHHEIEEGTQEELKNTDLVSLKKAGLKAIAAAPVMDFTNVDPVGAIVLTGKPNFLNPMVDLIVLRELGDKIAEPLRDIIGKELE
jgi:hypothetical protein